MFCAPIQTLHFLHKRNRSLPRYIVCNAVLAIASPSIWPSVWQMRKLWQNERNCCPH